MKTNLSFVSNELDEGRREMCGDHFEDFVDVDRDLVQWCWSDQSLSTSMCHSSSSGLCFRLKRTALHSPPHPHPSCLCWRVFILRCKADRVFWILTLIVRMHFLSIMKLILNRSGRIQVRRHLWSFHRSVFINEWMSFRFVCWWRWFLLDNDRATTQSSLSRRMFDVDWERNEWSVENVEWSSCSSSFECGSIVVDGHIIDVLLSSIVDPTTIVLVASMDSIEQSNNDFLSIESHFVHFHEQHSTVHHLASSFFDCDNTKMIFAISLVPVVDSTIGICRCLVLIVIGRSREDQHVSIIVFDSVGFEWRRIVDSNIDDQSHWVLHSSRSSADLSIDDLCRCSRHTTGHTRSTSSTDLQSLFGQSHHRRVDVSSSGLSCIECESLLFVDLSVRSVAAVEWFDQSDRWMDMFLFVAEEWWWDLSILSRQWSNIHSSIADLRSAWDERNRNGSMLSTECIDHTATDHWSTISFHFELLFPNVSIVLCVSGWESSVANGWTSGECREWTSEDRCFCTGGPIDGWESHTLLLHSSDDICQWSVFDASTSAMEWSWPQWWDERRTQHRGHHGVGIVCFYRRADLFDWSATRCKKSEWLADLLHAIEMLPLVCLDGGALFGRGGQPRTMN